jgi:hypothetical protein
VLGRGYADFYEKALFVKGDVATALGLIGPGLCLLLRQEIDDDPGVETAVANAWQDGELRVRESFAQGEGVLHGDLLVAIADHD